VLYSTQDVGRANNSATTWLHRFLKCSRL